MWAVVLACALFIGEGWFIYLNQPEYLIHENRLQAIGNYNLSNSFAFFLTMVFPLAFALLETAKKTLTKSVLIALMVLMAVTCFYTKSRGGTLAMMIGACLCLFFSERFVRSK